MGIIFEGVEGFPFFDGELDFHDDINCSRNGYSFLNDPMNHTLTSADTRGYIFAGIMSNGCRREEFFGVEEEDGMVNRARVEKWLKLVEQFVILLAIAVHISGGQPARGTEVTSYTLCNTGCMVRLCSLNPTARPEP
jgi:hypothetical protein